MALVISSTVRGVAVPLAIVHALKPKVGVHFTWAAPGTTTLQLVKDGVAVHTPSAYDAALYLAQLTPDLRLDGSGGAVEDVLVVGRMIDLASKAFVNGDYAAQTQGLAHLNEHLKIRVYVAGYHLTVADLALADAIKASPVVKKTFQQPDSEQTYIHVLRWLGYVESHSVYKQAASEVAERANVDKEAMKKKDQGSLEIDLVGATKGNVVTRFPPEPSGYLHIGHAKAALLNEYFARHYEGKLIVRFDDTNPSKEKEEFEHAIMEDLATLHIKADELTYTSNWFDKVLELAWKMIREDKAYVDDTPKEEMRSQRMDGLASKNRTASMEENLRKFQEMVDGTEYGKTCCLRAKMSVDSKNKALRDPVMYRCSDIPHARTGTKYKLYPTYDFACPIVDSLEGVTYALRTNEYHDRNDQYYWFIDALGLRKPQIWDYSRMNFVFTLLSKRKLTWFVDNKVVAGWDDPRFPTVRGVMRRGLTVEALKEYIIMQGASKNILNLEWDKLWALNRKALDPSTPRHTGIVAAVPWMLVNGPEQPYSREMPKHKKNPDVGIKTTWFSRNILIEAEDAKDLALNDEITLMDWGNAIVRKIERDAHGKVIAIEGELHLEGDVKKTKKLTWLAKEGSLIKATLKDYDYLLTKKKIEEDEDFKEFINPLTEFTIDALVDNNLQSLKKGQFVQLERKGFYICDSDSASGELRLIIVPDGKMKAQESGAPSASAPKSSSSSSSSSSTSRGKEKDKKEKNDKDKGDKNKEKEKPKDKGAAGQNSGSSNNNNINNNSKPSAETAAGSTSEPIMYRVQPQYDVSVDIDVTNALSGMYAVKPVY